MTRYTTTDVLICGAGVTGLTLAIELARHGVSFRLIEKRATPFIGSRGKGIQPRTQEIFEDLGILNKVVAAGGLYPRLRTYRHDGSYVDSDIAHHTKPTHAEPYHLPLMVPQNVTETIMREQLKAWGHRVEFGCELRHFAQTPRTVTAYVAGPAGEEVIIAHYLIGADGGGSFVRKKLGVSFPGRTLGRDFRYACGIRYQPLTIDIPANNKISITLNEPKTGWEATYIEATFNDGYVATSQVYITPDEKYPQTAPPSVNAACQTLPGRGLGENDSLD